jgi:hypothetical protein
MLVLKKTVCLKQKGEIDPQWNLVIRSGFLMNPWAKPLHRVLILTMFSSPD